jgi:hypothetical protein
VVYVAVLGPGGAPLSSPMAIADATGFALASAGARASLWLLQDRELSYLDLTCAPADG